jgi:hypothetical protein
MLKIKTQFVICILVFTSHIVQAQSLGFLNQWNKKRIDKRNLRWENEKVYVQKLYGLTFQSVQNQNFSQNQYPGLMFAMDKNRVIDRKKGIKVYDNNLKIGVLSLPNAFGPTISGNWRLGASYLQKLNTNFAVGAQAAASLNGRLNTNYENNAISMEAVIDIGPRIKYQSEFDFIFGKYGLEYNLSIPFVAFGFYAPGYNTSFGNNTKGLFLPNKYQRVQSGLFLTLPKGKRYPNKNLKIGYQWDYMHQDLGNKLGLFNTTHTLSFIGSIQKIK